MNWKFWQQPDRKKLVLLEFEKIYDKWGAEGIPKIAIVSIVSETTSAIAKMVNGELKE